jgi:hypothetical protein
MRRQDPVKRAIGLASFLVALVLVWSGWLQVKLGYASHEQAKYEGQWAKLEKNFKSVTENLQKTAEIESKLAAAQVIDPATLDAGGVPLLGINLGSLGFLTPYALGEAQATVEAANAYLRAHFIADYDAQFTCPPADPDPAFVTLGAVDLALIDRDLKVAVAGRKARSGDALHHALLPVAVAHQIATWTKRARYGAVDRPFSFLGERRPTSPAASIPAG